MREDQEKIEPSRRGPVKPLHIDRQQKTIAIIDVEELIPQDHKARAIWHLTGKLDLSGFTEGLRGAEGSAGRPAWDPRLLTLLEGAGLISLERLMQDGTKVRAQAGDDSMRRRGTISRLILSIWTEPLG